jgi:hypothetical protein
MPSAADAELIQAIAIVLEAFGCRSPDRAAAQVIAELRHGWGYTIEKAKLPAPVFEWTPTEPPDRIV